jgi:hypothetical protein
MSRKTRSTLLETRSTLLAAMAAVLVTVAAPVAGAAGLEIVEVRIHARQVGTDVELGWVNPGDTLTLPPGTEVRLWIEALPRHRGPRYPGATYEVAGGTVVEDRKQVVVRTDREDRLVAGIRNANPERGSAVLQSYSRQGESVVRYTLLDTIKGLRIPNDLRSSAFTVRVSNDAQLVPVDAQPAPIETDAARQAAAELYRGILLREPDPEGLAAYGERIRERGYAGMMETAVEIARSEESRVSVYRNGASYEQRLATLYEHLLGIDPAEVDRDQWLEDLESLRAGHLDRVVEEMAQSETFRNRFGFRVDLRRFAVPRR